MILMLCALLSICALCCVWAAAGAFHWSVDEKAIGLLLLTAALLQLMAAFLLWP